MKFTPNLDIFGYFCQKIADVIENIETKRIPSCGVNFSLIASFLKILDKGVILPPPNHLTYMKKPNQNRVKVILRDHNDSSQFGIHIFKVILRDHDNPSQFDIHY